MGNKRVPEIRFPGFTYDWEQRKLKDIATILDGDRGKNYPSGKDFTEQGHTLFLNATNVTKNGFIFENNQYITKEKSDLLGNGKLSNNDIILTSRGSVGHIAWYDKDTMEKVPFARINSGMLILRSNEENFAGYIVQYLRSPIGKRQIDLLSFGSAQPQLTKKDISIYKILVPKLIEQQRIGDYFKLLDNTIALHQQELETLKQTKQGFLQKMFPKEGESVPEIRFPGFSEEWQFARLGCLTNIRTGSSDLKDADPEGDYPFFVRSNNIEKSNRYLFDGEAILIPGEGRLGEIYHYINGKFDYHQRVYKISEFNDSDTDGKFVFYNLKTHFKRHALKYTVKATVDSLRLPMLNEYGLYKPTLEEQQKIGNFFKQLDETIVIQEQELEVLIQTKKAFLQKMFI